ncbi:MAG TPA: saccharopine dehydrogenase C-terminal domain-containing protein [Candidatus Binatia bacterium]|nr:saccharopine dehydrogenase C-terminal domain-containing protein [Candidatus Binatia bacterium]
MRILVIGAGMMGWAAAVDMVRSERVQAVTLADRNEERLGQAIEHIRELTGSSKVSGAHLDAADTGAARDAMRGHDGVLSAVPYFLNLGLVRAAIRAGCHFADLGGNNSMVQQEFKREFQAEAAGVAIAPDCGLSPGMASILGGELLRRIGGRAESLKIYVGGLPRKPQPPFNYQLVFSVEGLINEYCEPSRILRGGEIITVEPLTEVERFQMEGFPELEAFHTSGGTSTLPETFQGQVGECFEKTLRYPGHVAMLRTLYELGMFSSEKRRINGAMVAPRQATACLFEEKFRGEGPDVTLLRIEARQEEVLASFSMVDYSDEATGLTSMMRTTAWPASIVLQMLISGEITRRGGIRQEIDVPAQLFLTEMAKRGIAINYRIETVGELREEALAAQES